MGRSHSTISRELKRYQADEQGYRPDKAHQQAQWRHQQSKVTSTNISDECIATIKQRLAGVDFSYEIERGGAERASPLNFIAGLSNARLVNNQAGFVIKMQSTIPMPNRVTIRLDSADHWIAALAEI
jgi:hypothetical protein